MKSSPAPAKIVEMSSHGGDEVLAVAAKDDVGDLEGQQRMAVKNDVVAGVAVNDVGAAHVGDDVVAGAAEQVVVAEAALDAVVAAVAIDGVIVGGAGDEDVVALGAAENDRLGAGVVQVVGIRPDCVGVVADHERRDLDAVDRDAAGRIGTAEPRIELMALIDLEDELWRLEYIGRQMLRVGVEHHQLGERIVLELGAEVQARRARQVVEAVAVLEGFELVLEHEVEGRAQQAAERHLLFGKAADPEVDVVDAGRRHAVGQVGVDAGAVQEIEPVGLVGGEGPLTLPCPR